MKRFTRNLLVLALGATVLFTSCGDDEEDVPTAAMPSISVSAVSGENGAIQDGANVTATDSVTLSVSFTAAGGVNTLYNGQTAISRNDLGLEAGATSGSASFKTITTEAQVGQTLTSSFVIVDDLDQADTVTFSFTVVAIPSPAAKVLSQRVLAAPLGDGSSKSFYSVSEDELYSHNDVIGTADPISANIDFAYYYGNSDEASLVSPSEYPSDVFDISAWGTRNQTIMVIARNATAEDFMALETVADVTAFLEDLDNNASQDDAAFGWANMVEGTIIGFETAGEIGGVLRVVSIETGFTGSIELELILAEAAE